MKKALFLTDSLGVPRLQPSPIYDDEVWVSRLAKKMKDKYDFYYFTLPGLHTGMVASNLKNQLGAFRPDLILLQVGIVDCAPRALKEWERKVTARLPSFLRIPILKGVRRFYKKIVKFRKISYVPLSQFQANLELLKKHFGDAQFLVIPIAPANQSYKSRNPLIEEHIERYNAVIRLIFQQELVPEVYPSHKTEALFLADNHHLSVVGHQCVFSSLLEQLESV